MFKGATLDIFFMILIIMGSYLKHMDGVIFHSCTALPLGHSLFRLKTSGGVEAKENFHMLTFTKWFLLIALHFLICPGLMLLKVGLEGFYWSHALRRTQFFLIALASQPGSFLPDILCYSSHSPHQTRHAAFVLGKEKGTHWLTKLPLGSALQSVTMN